MEPSTLETGSIFEDRYEILGGLGAGSFARVYEARQLSTGQSVAIKLLAERDGAGREVERFRREMEICAALSHPNIVGLIDSGETASGRLYAVFEHIPGETLAQVLEREGALGVAESLRLMTQVLEALASAHTQGIVHRDLKPANLMLSSGGVRRSAMVLDFGLGAMAEDRRLKEWETLTQSQEFLGTPLYAAPEQLEGKVPGERSDLYSWGLILLECLTGRHPFAEQGALARLVAGSGAVVIPRWLHDHRLGELLAWVTAHDPERRDVTAVFLIKEFEEIAGATLPVAPAAPHESAQSERGEPHHPSAGSSPERRLSAIVSADVVGYSRLMAADEDSTVRMVKAYREEIELRVRQYRGRMDFTGDNFLAEFRSAIEAVECALEIQRVLGTLNAHVAANRRMEFRIGIHLGDVRFQGERMFGTGVNIAARLEGLADPGGLCISGAVREQLHGKLDLALEDLGEQSIKNIPDPVHVFALREAPPGLLPQPTRRPAVRWAVAAGAILALASFALVVQRIGVPAEPERETIAGGTPGAAPLTSIVVLPFDDMSPGGDQKWLADSTAEELIDALSRIEELRVIARTSAFAHRGADIATIGARLQVGAVVEGSLRRSGDQLRVTAQLIRVADSSHLWSGSYTRRLSDVFAIQHEVAVEVAEAVRAELGVGKTASWLIRSRYSTPDVRAWELLRKGLDRGRTWTEEGLRDQIALSVRALEIDPEYADAHAQRAWGHLLLRTFGYDRGEENLSSARNAAERALELDPNNGHAHHLLAEISVGNFDWEEAETRYVRALKAAPGDGSLTFGYGNLLVSTGRIKEAAPHLHRAVALDPQLGPARFSLGNLYVGMGDYQAAVGELERASALFYPGATELLSYAHHLNGDDERASETVIQNVSPPELRAAWQRAFDEAGYPGMVRATLDYSISRSGRPCTNNPFYASFRFAIIGEPDRMFECLEIAIRLRHPYAGGTLEHPPFGRYLDDPRFTALPRGTNPAD